MLKFMKTREELFGKEFLSRSEIVYGEETLKRLSEKRIAVVGLGGVGSAAAEALCRLGAENVLFIDREYLETSNLNRHFQSSVKNIGREKAAEMSERCAGINPRGSFTAIKEEITPENVSLLADFKPDFVLDAVDDIGAKIAMARICAVNKTGFISSMGAGWKKDPSMIKISLLSETKVCPLARKMRKELKSNCDFPVVYSTEVCPSKEKPVGSSFIVTAVFGFYMAKWILDRVSVPYD